MSYIPRRVYLATQAITAAETLDPGFFDVPKGTRCLTFYVTYEGDAADSQLDLEVEWSSDLAGTEDARDLVIQNGLDVTQPEGRYDVVASVERGPQPGAAATIVYTITARVPGGARRVRLSPTGVNDDGTITIALTGASTDCGGAPSSAFDGAPLPPSGIPASVDFIIPRTIHLDDGAGAAVTLPAAGAFTNQAAFSIPPGLKKIAFDCVYTRGAAGGFPVYNILWGDGTVETRAIVIDQNSLAIAGDDGEFNVYQEQILGPAPVAGDPIEYKLEYEIPAGESQVRLLAAERGATATPGDLLITLTGRG